MPDAETVWIGRILQKDAASDLSLVLVRGIFRTKRDAKGVAAAFGCDCVMFAARDDQVVSLGQIIAVDMKNAPMEEH